VKGKINMAMSYGVPVIATGIAVEGMHLEDGRDVLRAETPEAFARAAQRLQQDDTLWTRLSDASLDNVRRHFSAEAARQTLRRALDIQPEREDR
jgi:glycosyltransferase involved in cell wall biosynthesis